MRIKEARKRHDAQEEERKKKIKTRQGMEGRMGKWDVDSTRRTMRRERALRMGGAGLMGAGAGVLLFLLNEQLSNREEAQPELRPGWEPILANGEMAKAFGRLKAWSHLDEDSYMYIGRYLTRLMKARIELTQQAVKPQRVGKLGLDAFHARERVNILLSRWYDRVIQDTVSRPQRLGSIGELQPRQQRRHGRRNDSEQEDEENDRFAYGNEEDDDDEEDGSEIEEEEEVVDDRLLESVHERSLLTVDNFRYWAVSLFNCVTDEEDYIRSINLTGHVPGAERAPTNRREVLREKTGGLINRAFGAVLRKLWN